MGVTRYKCFIGHNSAIPTEISEIGLFRGDKIADGNYAPSVIRDSDDGRRIPLNEEGVAHAIAVTEGLFDPNTTFTAGENVAASLQSVNIGCINIGSGNNTKYLTFSNGNSIAISFDSVYGYYSVYYRIPSPTGYKQSGIHHISASHRAIGLISEQVYEWESNDLKYIGLMIPALSEIEPSPATRFTIGGGSSSPYLYPTYQLNLGGVMGGDYNRLFCAITDINNRACSQKSERK